MATLLVTVKLKNHQLTIDYMSRKIDPGSTDQFGWRCDDAQMEVDFNYPEGSPFGPPALPTTHFAVPKATTVTSGSVNPPDKTKYRYQLTVYHPAYALGPVVIDPEVDVDSGVPGAGVRHSGRKKAAKGARKRAAKRGTAGKKK